MRTAETESKGDRLMKEALSATREERVKNGQRTLRERERKINKKTSKMWRNTSRGCTRGIETR